MSAISLLLPDFLLILIGYLLFRFGSWEDFWSGLDRLVYHILFPALLFYSSSKAPLDFGNTGKMLQIAVFVTLCGVALGWLAKYHKAAPMIFESGVQTAFRFNSYVGLAAATRIAGEEGASLLAILLGFCVPLCNMMAVYALVHKRGGVLRELARNPLIMATAAGITCNLAGIHLPEVVTAILSRLGNAAIAMGLIAVGAGLRLQRFQEAHIFETYYFTFIKLVILPGLALWLGTWINLPPLQLQIAVVFCALPTASSAYVLTMRTGGNGPFVAFLISISTLLSIITLPFWVSLAMQR